jgi:hypothetical protein
VGAISGVISAAVVSALTAAGAGGGGTSSDAIPQSEIQNQTKPRFASSFFM